MSSLLASIRNSPGLWLFGAALVLLFACGTAVAWMEGWIGAPAYRAGCAAVSRSGGCP